MAKQRMWGQLWRGTTKSLGWAIPILVVLTAVLFFVSIVFLVFAITTRNPDIDIVIGVVINSTVDALGFCAIYASIQTDKEIKRFEFVEEYNFHFLSNNDLSLVERKLESCYQEYKRIDEECHGLWENEQETQFRKHCDEIFKTIECEYANDRGGDNSRIDQQGCISKGYQKLIKYLVYLESFVPLISNRQLDYETVDDLFGYRYFIAVNNPVLQLNELIPERKYYRGIYKVYEEWKSYRHNDIPMPHYDLMAMWDQNNGKFHGAKE